MKKSLFVFLAASLLLGTRYAASQTNDELEAQVRAAEIAFALTMENRDFESFKSHIADDAIFFGDQGAWRGLDAVSAAWQPLFEGDTAPFSWEPKSVEVLESGTLAHSSGPVRNTNGVQVSTYNSIWRLEDSGQWRVIFDKGCDQVE